MYLKIILTLILITLIIRCSFDVFPIAQAQTDSIMQVDICAVNGRRIFLFAVPVKID